LLKNSFLTRIRLKTWFKKPNLTCSSEQFKFGLFLYTKNHNGIYILPRHLDATFSLLNEYSSNEDKI
ncbi:hypothetical protein, partial [Colwellia sp. BRX8-9]|uniref:hypothetical protein n=1 Tax=Colwellia sp. BRX8-9 TaxID=2759831 RepID=UPI001C70EBDB